MNHRDPPLPKSFTDPPRKGYCRWCGKPVNEPRRRLWHKACLDEHRLITFQHTQYEALVERDGHRCAICGKDGGEWNGYIHLFEIDHIVPLQSAPRELHYWTLPNLQLLCHECHVLKTTVDNRLARQSRRPDPPPLAPVSLAEIEPLFHWTAR